MQLFSYSSHPSQCTLPICDDLDDEEEEENFQTVSCTMEEISDRHLCIHEHSLPHELCPMPIFGLHIFIIL